MSYVLKKSASYVPCFYMREGPAAVRGCNSKGGSPITGKPPCL